MSLKMCLYTHCISDLLIYHFQAKGVQLDSFPFKAGPFNFYFFNYSFLLDRSVVLLLHLFSLLLAYLSFHTVYSYSHTHKECSLNNSIEKPWMSLIWILHFCHNMRHCPRSKNSLLLPNPDLFYANEALSASKISNCHAVVF